MLKGRSDSNNGNPVFQKSDLCPEMEMNSTVSENNTEGLAEDSETTKNSGSCPEINCH